MVSRPSRTRLVPVCFTRCPYMGANLVLRHANKASHLWLGLDDGEDYTMKLEAAQGQI